MCVNSSTDTNTNLKTNVKNALCVMCHMSQVHPDPGATRGDKQQQRMTNGLCNL